MKYLILILICLTFSLESKEEKETKSKEELIQERNDHIKEGAIEAGLTAVAATGAVVSGVSGHEALAIAEGAAAVVEGAKAVDEFKQAYDCQKKIKEIDDEENK